MCRDVIRLSAILDSGNMSLKLGRCCQALSGRASVLAQISELMITLWWCTAAGHYRHLAAAKATWTHNRKTQYEREQKKAKCAAVPAKEMLKIKKTSMFALYSVAVVKQWVIHRLRKKDRKQSSVKKGTFLSYMHKTHTSVHSTEASKPIQTRTDCVS